MKRTAIVCVTLVAITAAGCSRDIKDVGQSKSHPPEAVGTSVPADIASQDATDFVHHVAIVNNAEIDLGKLATARGSADGVKKFAQMMIADHTGSGDKLKTLASDLKLQAPSDLDDKHREQRDTLAKKSGTDFDRDYAKAMVDGHKDLIDQLEPRVDKKILDEWKAASTGTPTAAGRIVAIPPDRSDNPTTMRVNQFAADIYPTVYAHLEAAKALERSLEKREARP